MQKKHSILIVDDEEGILDYLQFGLEDEGYKVWTATSGDIALKTFASEKIDAILSDIRMPGMDGVTMLKSMRAAGPVPFFVFMTGFADFGKEKLLSLGASDILEKPINLDFYMHLLEKHLGPNK